MQEKHKDKKSKSEKKQAANGKTLEQKFVEVVRRDEVPAIRECDKDVSHETGVCERRDPGDSGEGRG